jgi:FkbM family methyltransferase
MTNVARFRALRRMHTLIYRAGLERISVVDKGVRYVREKWFKDVFDGSSQSLLVNLYGFKMLLPRRFVDHYVFHEYEPLTRTAFLDSLRPGVVVVDVGAHIGYFRLLAARAVGPTGKVHAVEPCEETVEFLWRNVSLNGFGNAAIHNLAAGRERAQRSFNVTGSSDSHKFYAHPLTGTLNTIEVTQAPLDEIVDGRVDLVKVDVEGAETEVLAGMKRILRDNPKISLCTELFPAGMRSAGYAPLELPNCLRQLGFDKLRVICDMEGRIYSVDEANRAISSGGLPTNWHANLWGERTL